MKNIVLLFAVVFAAVSASAQTQQQAQPLRVHPNADYIRTARVQLEKDTELKILEKLEESRLREERARMQMIEGTNFSVVNPAPNQPVQTQTF